MHHMDANEAYREKARRELHKNAASHIEQILEATSHNIAATRLPPSLLKSYPNKTWKTLLEK